MQKTHLGISVGLLGFIMCLIGLAGFTPMLLLGGYILLFESNEWLKKLTIKVFVIELFVYLVTLIIGLIPDAITFIGNVAGIFGSYFTLSRVANATSAITSVIGILEVVILVVMAIKSLNQGSLRFGFIEKFVQKHTDSNNNF